MTSRLSRFPTGILLLTLAASLWGAAAYLRMPAELLPHPRDRLLLALVEAPGHAASELAARFGPRAAPLFATQGFACEVEARYVSHGFSLVCRTPQADDLALRAGAVRRDLEQALVEAGLPGARVRWHDEPLADRVTLKVAFPETATEDTLRARVEALRGVSGVTAVRLLDGPAAWTGGNAFRVALVERDEWESPLEVSNGVRRVLGPEVGVFGDQAAYVEASESNLFENIVSGTLLTVVCVFVFLRAFRSTLLVGLSIPLCVLLSIPFLVALGVTRNVMSLSGLALSVGIVVDASLSIVSDFDERLASGRFTPAQAAWRTVSDSITPLFVATLSTLAVFVPILFLEGRVGELFSELAKAVIVSNVVGLFVSLVSVPCLLVLGNSASHHGTPSEGNKEGATGSIATPTRRGYKGANAAFPSTARSIPLRRVLSWDPWMRWCASGPLRSALFLALSGVAVVLSLDAMPAREFLPPPRDGNGFAELAVPSPSDGGLSSPDAAPALARSFEAALLYAGAKKVFVSLDADRFVASFDAAGVHMLRLRTLLRATFPDRAPFVALENPLRPSREQRSDVAFYFRANESTRDRLARWLESHPGVEEALLASQDTEPVQANPWRPDPTTESTAPRSLERRYLDSPLGLDAGRFLRRDPRTITWVGDGPWEEGRVKLRFEETTLSFQDALAAFTTSTGIALRKSPAATEAERSLADLVVCLLLAVGIIFAILWFQNRSVTKSLIILATFAWAPLGAVPALRLHGETLNGSALVGFILLAGTIVNNGILLMDRIEKNIHAQMSVFDAAVEGVRERSLNVVITGLTTVLAMLPMIFGGQEGAQMYRSLSIVVVYGTLASTPVSFLGIPALLVARQGLFEGLARARLRRRIRSFRSRHGTRRDPSAITAHAGEGLA